MKVIILAAGQGKRLRPHTDDRPKCLVELAGKALLDRQVSTLKQCGLQDIIILGGWCADQLQSRATRFYTNPAFDSSNMVETLFCAKQEFDGSDDMLICYSDIVYESKIISAILSEEAPIATTIDGKWRALWEFRMDNPLEDAETLKLDEQGSIVELGKKAQSYAEIEGQYMGIIKLSASMQKQFVAAFEALPETDEKGAARKDIYMTDFLQHFIDAHAPIKAVCVDGGWLEVDTLEDIARYEAAYANGTLNNIVNLDA